MAVVRVAGVARPVCVVVSLLLLVFLIFTKMIFFININQFFINMLTSLLFLTLSALSSGSSSVKNSLFG